MKMEKTWLRGTLLGLSLALLLAGGVALAQTLTLVADKECVECWPGPYNVAPPDEYVVNLTLDGWVPGEKMCENIYLNGESLLENGEPICGYPPEEEGPYKTGFFVLPCDLRPQTATTTINGSAVVLQADITEELYGEWRLRVWQPATGDVASATWLFAESCAGPEFVPEPGTIALLATGLAGMAGYAALRWRARR
jgi:hypothetical protein